MTPSTEIRDLATSIGVLAGQVSEEQWAFLSLVRDNMLVQAELMERLEKNVTLNPVKEQ